MVVFDLLQLSGNRCTARVWIWLGAILDRISTQCQDMLLMAWYRLMEKVVCRCGWDYGLCVAPNVLVYVLLSSLDWHPPGQG